MEFSTSRIEPHERARNDDFEYAFQSIIRNTAILDRMLTSTSVDYVVGGVVRPVIGTMKFTVDALWANGKELDLPAFQSIASNPIAVSVPSTYPRYSIVQIQGDLKSFDNDRRSFFDPELEVAIYRDIDTKYRLIPNIVVKNGAEGVYYAPTTDPGFVKIAEIYLEPEIFALTDNNIKNVTAAFSGELNNEWTSEKGRTFSPTYTLEAIGKEAQARQQGDATLQNNINAEAQARQQGDATLQNNINAEAQARQQGDATLDADVVKLTGNQTINGVKTFTTFPVVPNKNSNAVNSPTVIATEAQVYLKENADNKKTSVTNSDTDFPTGKAVLSKLNEVAPATFSLNPQQEDTPPYSFSGSIRDVLQKIWNKLYYLFLNPIRFNVNTTAQAVASITSSPATGCGNNGSTTLNIPKGVTKKYFHHISVFFSTSTSKPSIKNYTTLYFTFVSSVNVSITTKDALFQALRNENIVGSAGNPNISNTPIRNYIMCNGLSFQSTNTDFYYVKNFHAVGVYSNGITDRYYSFSVYDDQDRFLLHGEVQNGSGLGIEQISIDDVVTNIV